MRKLRFPWTLVIIESCALIGLLIFSLLYITNREIQSTPVKAQQAVNHIPQPLAHASTPEAVINAGADGDDVQQEMREELAWQRLFYGPDGWMWRTTLPTHRLVIYYGNPLSAAMGPIGSYDDTELLNRLQQQAQAYATLDPTHSVIPALDYVTPVAQPYPMADGSWVSRMPQASIEHYIQLANAHHALFFFDMQIGHSTIQHEVNVLRPYLALPAVDLALDPEFDMAPGDTPGQEFGRMSAAEINWVIGQLSQLVIRDHLPPKILIIHQFREQMLPDWQKIKSTAQVQIITCVDGFGSPGSKLDDYRMFDHDQLIQYPGVKLFYTQDKPLMTPRDVLNMQPVPTMVMYQ
ncbi:MAG TPA: hypothetical protein VL485_09805 [Ktedonobacteraceae bacterium]|jgi:hypothetical protein|nr:hypothetical protein [Ktedonobacteraceae bacterium]